MTLLTYEDELEYLANVVENANEKRDWKSAVEKLGADIHYDSLRKAFDTTKYSGYNVMQYYKNKATKYLADEEIAKLEQLKDEIYKERVRMQDASREKRNVLREEARYENLVEVLTEKLDLFEYLPCNFSARQIESNNEAFAMLSDLHFALKSDNVLMYYDIDTSIKMLNTWAEKVVEYCKCMSVNKVHIGLNGDLLNGFIHLAHRVSQEEDLVSQTIDCGEILSKIIQYIKSEVPEVKVYGAWGNHSRLSPNKKESIGIENMERIIFKHIEMRTGIKVIQNGLEDFVTFKIKDKKIVMTHGDKDSLSNAKTHFCNVLNYVPDIIYLGHIHHLNIKDDSGTEIVVNGSFVSVDDYAMGLRVNTKPYQIMQIFNGEDVITVKLDLH